MRIAYVVDVHDRFDAVGEALEALGEVDVLLVGGDLTNLGTADDAERAIELWRPLAPQLFALAGNMGSPAIDERLVDLGVSLDGRGVVVEGVGFAGVSAAPLSPLAFEPVVLPMATASSAVRSALPWSWGIHCKTRACTAPRSRRGSPRRRCRRRPSRRQAGSPPPEFGRSAPRLHRVPPAPAPGSRALAPSHPRRGSP